jgi:hypothetical protein
VLSVVCLCSYSPSLVFLLQGRAGDETRTINGEERQQDDLNDDEVDDDNNIFVDDYRRRRRFLFLLQRVKLAKLISKRSFCR